MKAYAKSDRSRRGVVLMIVLALLATFAVVAMTFLLAASQTRNAAEQHLMAENNSFNPNAMLMEAGMWVLRGDTKGGAGQHSLLEDMYGSDGTTTNSTLTFYNTSTANLTSPYVFFTGASDDWAGRTLSVVPGDQDAGARYAGLSGFVVKVESGTAYVLPYTVMTGIPEGTAAVKVIVNPLPYQGANRDYDAPDDNNKFLAARDPKTGQVQIVSYRGHDVFNPAATKPYVDSDNDGKADSIWVDLNFPAFIAPDGRRCKVYFAFVVEDLDNRLSPNVHGRPNVDDVIYGSSSGTTNPFNSVINDSALRKPASAAQTRFAQMGSWGAGFGPGEIPLYALALNDSGSYGSVRTAIPTLMTKKFTANESLSVTPRADRMAIYTTRGIWYKPYNPALRATLTGAGSNVTQATPLDIRGVLAMGVDTTGAPLYGRVSKDFAPTQAPNAYVDGKGKTFFEANSYDLDIGIYAKHGVTMRKSTAADLKDNWDQCDAPYSVSELEAVIRPFDIDSGHLPQRLRQLVAPWGQNEYFANRFAVTTEIWNSPTISNAESIRTTLSGKLGADMLADWSSGLPFDLLRLAMREGIGYDQVSAGTYTSRQRYAKCIFELLEALGVDMGGLYDKTRNNAQWAVNVVDFFDADNVITPFEYASGRWVYGCERPELLISETLAMHTRNTENDPPVDGASSLKAGGKRDKPAGAGTDDEEDPEIYESYNPDQPDTIPAKIRDKVIDIINNMPANARPDGEVDLDQWLRPQGTLMVGLYNPWSNQATGDRQEPCDTISGLWSGEGVDLAKIAGGSPVWRLVVTTDDGTKDPDEYLHSGGTMQNVERVIHFASVATTPDGLTAEFVYAPSQAVPVIPAGRHALIAPYGTTVLSFNNAKESTDGTVAEIKRKIDILPAQLTIDGTPLSNVVAIPIDECQNARLSLTEFGDYPTENYDPNTMKYSTAYDKPFDITVKGGKRDAAMVDLLATNKNNWNYRTIHLQRLANPAIAFDSRKNPYVTVDSMPVDLHVYNARTSDFEMVGGTEKKGDAMESFKITSRKRGQSLFANNTPIDAKYQNISMIWRQEPLKAGATPFSQCEYPAGANNGGTFTGIFSHIFDRLGRQSTSGTVVPFDSEGSGALQGLPTKPMPWLTWLNRTPTGPADLMLVPNRSSSMLLRDFDVEKDGTAKPNNVMGYLPNFRVGDRHKVLEYFRMPAQQIVSPMLINPSVNNSAQDKKLPFAFFSMYREPGKLNINTIYSEKVFRGLMGRPNLESAVYDSVSGGNLWNSFLTSRGGTTAAPWEVKAPFRSFNGGGGLDSTLMRQHPSNPQYGLFENRSTELWNSTENQAFFRYQQYGRLMNLTTTRSSVFAVWVTMGLFEVDGNGQPIKVNVNGNNVGVEVGADNGELRRYRAFFIIDRSLPVGYQKGKNTNVDRAMLIRRFL